MIQRAVLKRLIQSSELVFGMANEYSLALTSALAIADRMRISLDAIQRL
jgi:hypothetical protein